PGPGPGGDGTPRGGSGRTRAAGRPRLGQRTRPTTARSEMLVAEARTLRVITGRQPSDDHLRVRASTCSDTPPASIAGRSYLSDFSPACRAGCLVRSAGREGCRDPGAPS